MAGGREAERLLLDRCRRGDEAAWAELFREHAPRLAAFLRGVLSRCDVDDLVQRVFLELLSSLDRFRGEASIATWLRRIAVHVAQKEARSFWRRRRKIDAWAFELDAAADPDATDRLAAREELQRIAGALDQLDWRFRTVWVMRELEGMSVEDVAAALGERPATVRTRHHRARTRLCAALGLRSIGPVADDAGARPARRGSALEDLPALGDDGQEVPP